MNKVKCIFVGCILFLSSCGTSIEESDLQGKWVYKEVSYLKENPPVTEKGTDLTEKHPYMLIGGQGELAIYSEDKILSKGTFTLERNIIRYEEVLEGGIKRKIPFLIKELTAKTLSFETMDSNTIRIVAEKE